ncbi:MAG TPA: TetR family transcriptional regulator, partial [Puia sp.]|nr:TetR family transcriptional regulator [Puia sp.]
MAKGKSKAGGASAGRVGSSGQSGAAGRVGSSGQSGAAKGRKAGAAGKKRAAQEKSGPAPGRSKTAESRPRRKTVDTNRSGRAKGPSGPAESTEERIKEAAQKLFTQNGFAATRTRDIAKEAGINLALLNYYFRSKQKLFDLIMIENFRKFLTGMKVNFQDPTLSMEERLRRIVTAYVDFLTEFPDLPLFILNEIRGNPSKIAEQVRAEVGPARSEFFKELQGAKKEGKIELEPFHFVANLVGLTVFPFVARPLLQRV